MRKLWQFYLAIGVMLAASANPSAAQAPSSKQQADSNVHAPARKAAAAKALSVPLFFEANKGQTDPHVRFLTRGSGYTMFLTPAETVLSESKASPTGKTGKIGAQAEAVIKMQLVGANAAPVMTGLDELPGKVNYLIGNVRAKWHTGIPLYSDVRSEQVYPGVDLLFHGNKRQLEYDFTVSPGADPSKIAFRIRGARKIELDSRGDLVLHTSSSQFLMYKPVVYQTVASERHEVEGSFILKGKNEVAFQIGAYDRRHALVIDPAIGYATFLGGASFDEATDLKVDNSNPSAPKVYVIGLTLDTTSFPESSNPLLGSLGGGEYGFVAKINPTITNGTTASLDYLTFVGGSTLLPASTQKECDTLFEDFSLDLSQGTSSVEPVIGGITSCSDYPGTPTQPVGGPVTGFVTRLNAAGSGTDASIIIGGNGGDYDIFTSVDPAGNVIAAGSTSSTNLPVTPGAYMPTMNNGGIGFADCFVSKLERSDLAATYESYLNAGGGSTSNGGSGLGGIGFGCGAIEDVGGKIDAGGSTVSSTVYNVGPDGQNLANGFETTFPAGATKVTFAMQIDPTVSGTAALLYGTYYGGGGITNAQGGSVDLGNGVLAIVGGTTSNTSVGDIPLHNAFQSTNLAAANSGTTGYLLFINTAQTGAAGLLCSTYFGGSSGIDQVNSVAYDANDPTAYRIIMGGETGSATDFPTLNSLQAFQGTQDGFVAELKVPLPGQNFNASLYFSTYIGGGASESIQGVGVDSNDTVYAAGVTLASDFFSNTTPPTVVNGFQTSCDSCDGSPSEPDAVVFSLTTSEGATLQSITVAPANATIAASQTQQYTAEGFYSDGTIQNITTSVAWSSSNTNLATISNTDGLQGLATGVAAGGPVTITATLGAISGTAILTITSGSQFELTYIAAGTGTGTVTSNPAGINCAQSCTADFTSGTVVTLTATPNGGSANPPSTFAGWSGACTNTTGTCVVTMSAAKSVTATFNLPTFALTATVLGTGTGTLTSSPAGINCTTGSSTGCTANFTSGIVVTMTETPGSNSTFVQWGGQSCGGTTCTVTMNSAQSVSATFNASSYPLTVTENGTGSGTVLSESSGRIVCPSVCTANYGPGAQVTLAATPSDGSTFAGWGGACSGTGSCQFTMNAAETVTATFNLPVQSYPLTVTVAGTSSSSGGATGTGTVTSAPAGIDCTGPESSSGSGCTADYVSGTVVTLTATPGSGSAFAGWTGACTNTTGTCAVTMTTAESVTATFTTTTFTLATGPGYSTTISTTPGGNIVVGLTLSSTMPGTVGLGCTSSAPQYLSCLITPSEVTLTGNGTTQVAIVLTSYCEGGVPGMPGGPGPGIPGGVVGAMLLGLALCGVAITYRGQRRWALSFALLLFATVGGAACNNLPQGTAGRTPPGNYTLTITATVAGQAPQSLQINVAVQ